MLYRKLAALLLFLAELYQTVGWGTLQFDRYIRLERKLAALLLFLAGLYQTVGWGTLQFDRKGYSASWLHYSYFWLSYTKPLGGAPYSLIDKVIAQAGFITRISGL